MNNLVQQKLVQFQNLLKDGDEHHLTLDYDHGIVYFVSNLEIYSLNLDSNLVSFLHSFTTEPDDVKIMVDFLIEDKLIFMLFESGNIITYDTMNNELLVHSIEVPGGIETAKFSADQELLAVLSKRKDLMLYNKLMLLKCQYDLNQEEYGASEMVNVNWGSKQTQFHGEGMRDKRVLKEEYFPLDCWDDRKSTCDWRSDDNFFVVNFVNSKGYRLLKLFNRDGILQHTSEYVAGLEKQIAWKPSGTLIAASRLTPAKHEIVLFEKNGLQHLNFKLNFEPKTFMIGKLVWSCDSEMFLVLGFTGTISPPADGGDCEHFEKHSQHLLIYTQSNYYWYLKHSFRFSDFVQDILCDERHYLKFHCITTSGTYLSKNFSNVCQTAVDGTVFVIDGHRLLVSDFQSSVVPPPLCNYSIDFKQPGRQIRQILFSKTLLAICTVDNFLVILKQSEATCQQPSTEDSAIEYNFINISNNLSTLYTPIFGGHISPISEVLLPILLEDGRVYGILSQHLVHFDHRHANSIELVCELAQPIETMAVIGENELLLSDSMGHYSCFDTETKLLKEQMSIHLPAHYNGDNCAHTWIHVDDEGIKHAIVYTRNRSLFFDQTLLKNSIVNSAFLYRNRYLLFTTIDNQFYCWPLEKFDLARLQKYHLPRDLERGSKIISACDARVIVQLPRGNLEAFYPRSLLLDQVNKLIDRREFLKAFEILRKHRINLNYICDYNFDLFMEKCDLFLEQLDQNSVEWICLFLFELTHANSYSQLHHLPEVLRPNKVDSICNTLQQKMIRLDGVKFLKPILLTFVRKTTPEVGNALRHLNSYPDVKLRDEGVKYLSLIVNVNKLFDEALGTYDFDILLMVASNTNKDPKEYIALINAFKEVEDDDYRRFKIDHHLQRYSNCLLHLSRCTGRTAEVLELIEARHLYKEAIELFDLNNEHSNQNEWLQIWNLYGEYLFKKKYYEESAIAFKRASNFKQAFKMYLMCSKWDLACVCARKFASDQEEFRKMINNLSQQLHLNGKHADSAYLLERYLQDYPQAFRILLKGREWSRAIRCMQDYDLDNLQSELKNSLASTYESLLDTVEANTATLETYFSRLSELKEIKEKNDLYGEKLEHDFDNYSDTSSVCDTASLKSSDSGGSVNTLKTNRTNARMKQQKRQQQRRYLLKRGSPNEDIQIVFAIKEILDKCGNIFEEGGPLIRALYDNYFVDHSLTLQSKLDSFHQQLARLVDFIWNSEYFQKRLSQDELLRMTPTTLATIPEFKIVLN